MKIQHRFLLAFMTILAACYGSVAADYQKYRHYEGTIDGIGAIKMNIEFGERYILTGDYFLESDGIVYSFTGQYDESGKVSLLLFLANGAGGTVMQRFNGTWNTAKDSFSGSWEADAAAQSTQKNNRKESNTGNSSHHFTLLERPVNGSAATTLLSYRKSKTNGEGGCASEINLAQVVNMDNKIVMGSINRQIRRLVAGWKPDVNALPDFDSLGNALIANCPAAAKGKHKQASGPQVYTISCVAAYKDHDIISFDEEKMTPAQGNAATAVIRHHYQFYLLTAQPLKLKDLLEAGYESKLQALANSEFQRQAEEHKKPARNMRIGQEYSLNNLGLSVYAAASQEDTVFLPYEKIQDLIRVDGPLAWAIIKK